MPRIRATMSLLIFFSQNRSPNMGARAMARSMSRKGISSQPAMGGFACATVCSASVATVAT